MEGILKEWPDLDERLRPEEQLLLRIGVPTPEELEKEVRKRERANWYRGREGHEQRVRELLVEKEKLLERLQRRRERLEYDYLWKHEWRKHGKCVVKLKSFGQRGLDYFRETLRLATELNERLDHWLNFELFPKGFSALADERFSFEKILDEIKALNDGKVAIVNWHTVEKNNWIHSINFCFSLFLEKKIDCNATMYQRTPVQ